MIDNNWLSLQYEIYNTSARHLMGFCMVLVELKYSLVTTNIGNKIIKILCANHVFMLVILTEMCN